MRPLILMPTINSRHWNACYLQLLSVQMPAPPPQAERSLTADKVMGGAITGVMTVMAGCS